MNRHRRGGFADFLFLLEGDRGKNEHDEERNKRIKLCTALKD